MSETRAERLAILRSAGVYLVTDDRVPRDRRRAIVEEALEAGVRVVQLRDKRAGGRALYEEAVDLVALCHGYGGLLIVNDRVDVAVASGSDGAHVGQDDLPARAARELLGPDMLLGVSASTVDEAIEVERSGADYLGFGAMFATPTKVDAEYAGPELLAEVKRRVALPVVAIGGITPGNIGVVRAAGADLVAVVGAVFGSPCPGDATRALLRAMGQPAV